MEGTDSAINSKPGESSAFLILLPLQVPTVFLYLGSKLKSTEQNILRVLQFSRCGFLRDFQYQIGLKNGPQSHD